MSYRQKRYGVEVMGKCRICGYRGKTQMHHIISQFRCRKIGKPELIKNQGNIVELCVRCHNLTTASMSSKRLRQTGKVGHQLTGSDKSRCKVVFSKGKKKGQQCSKQAKAAHGLCIMHHRGLWIEKFYDPSISVIDEEE